MVVCSHLQRLLSTLHFLLSEGKKVKESGCLWKVWDNTTQLASNNKSCTFNRL